MKRTYIIFTVIFLAIALTPYIDSFFSYRSSVGYLHDGDTQYKYAFVDMTHYDGFKMLVFRDDVSHDITVSKGKILVDKRPMSFSHRVGYLNDSGDVVPIYFDLSDFKHDTDWNSGVYGVLGPVPHFKDYEIEEVKSSILDKIPNKPDAGDGL
ncbi:MAG: hypothetical protein R6U98_36505 [Pirellulaceae bacterium]